MEDGLPIDGTLTEELTKRSDQAHVEKMKLLNRNIARNSMSSICLVTPSFGVRDPNYVNSERNGDKHEIKRSETKVTTKSKRMVRGLTFTSVLDEFQ